MRSAAVLAIAVANVLAGLTYPAQDLALAGLPPATVTLLRNLVALVALGVVVRLRGGLSGPLGRREAGGLCLLGVVSFALPLWLGTVGVGLSTAANGSILVLLEPPTILLLSAWLLRERVRAPQLAGVALGLGGALFVVLERTSAGGLVAREHLLGNVLLALHGVLWGTYTPLARVLARRRGALEVALFSTLFSLVVLVPAALVEGPSWSAGPELPAALLWTAGLGLVGSFVATALWVWAVGRLEGRRVAPFVFLQPAAGATAACLLLGEELTREAWIGSALIGAGILVGALGEPARAPSDGAAAT